MGDQLKNIMIGVFVIVGAGVATWVLLFLNPSTGDAGRIQKVRFTNVDKVSVGTQVTFAGKPIGEVIDIALVDDARCAADFDLGRPVYPYELTLQYDSRYGIHRDDEISVVTAGLLGERSININPRRVGDCGLLEDVSEEVVYAEPSIGVEETIAGIRTLLERVDGGLKELEKENFWTNLAEAVNAFKEIAQAINQPEDWKAIHDNIHRTTEAIVELTENINGDWSKIAGGIDDFSSAARHIEEVTAKVNRGEGTLGKIVAGDDMALQLASVLTKAEILMNDVNHYGVLFHLDRNWQRQRTRRLNKLEALCSTGQFRAYFDEEVDEINASLARVAMVMEETGLCDERCALTEDAHVQKAFRDLQRRLRSVSETLDHYNSWVHEKKALGQCVQNDNQY